jgi:N-carbamoyl-L-amino-acid hydrolase
MSVAELVDRERLARGIEALARFSDAPAPAVTRVVYTDTDLAARAWLREQAEDAGLDVRVDPIGNTFFRWEGSEPDLPAVATGSHIDAIPHAGRFDGVVGVLGGLEALRALRAAGVRPRRSLELILFTAEEPTRFGIGCFGSRALAGRLGPEDLLALTDGDGARFDDVRRAAGFEGDLADVRLPNDAYHAFVELHIEQGPLLERHGTDIGVVTSIAAPATLHVTLEGEGGHAGAVRMRDRKDALAAAAEVVGAVEGAALGHRSEDAVATVGVIDVHPGAVNSIPSRVFLTADVRDVDGARRDRTLARIREACDEIGVRRGVAVRTEVVNADPPAECAEDVRDAVRYAARRVDASHEEMVSRAYHDALFMAQICPTGMIFVPCRGGVSHRPDEYASPGAVARGTAVLAEALAMLSG